MIALALGALLGAVLIELARAAIRRLARRRDLRRWGVMSYTPEHKRRRDLLARLAPYVKRRSRDRPGQALRRAAYMAWIAGKITRSEKELFK